MTPTRSATVTALVAVVGLVVSVSVAWSAYSSGPEVQDSPPAAAARADGPVLVDAPGAVGAPAVFLPPPAAAEPVTRLVARSPKVRRADASLSAASRDRRTPRPARLRLGSIDLDAPVRPVGVRRDGQMALPADPEVLGWYRYGPTPRSGRGAVVVAGHLDSERFGIGPLVGLRSTKRGDTIRVASPDGRTTTYVVKQIRRYDRQRLPDQLFSRNGPERLHLITCGGRYSPKDGYELNLVVTAVPKR